MPVILKTIRLLASTVAVALAVAVLVKLTTLTVPVFAGTSLARTFTVTDWVRFPFTAAVSTSLLAIADTATPVPDNDTVCVPPAVTVRLPLARPATVGLKARMMVQLAPAFRVAVPVLPVTQLPPVLVKGPATDDAAILL